MSSSSSVVPKESERAFRKRLLATGEKLMRRKELDKLTISLLQDEYQKFKRLTKNEDKSQDEIFEMFFSEYLYSHVLLKEPPQKEKVKGKSDDRENTKGEEESEEHSKMKSGKELEENEKNEGGKDVEETEKVKAGDEEEDGKTKSKDKEEAQKREEKRKRRSKRMSSAVLDKSGNFDFSTKRVVYTIFKPFEVITRETVGKLLFGSTIAKGMKKIGLEISPSLLSS